MLTSHGITDHSLPLKEGDDFNSFLLKVSVNDVDKVKIHLFGPIVCMCESSILLKTSNFSRTKQKTFYYLLV